MFTCAVDVINIDVKIVTSSRLVQTRRQFERSHTPLQCQSQVHYLFVVPMADQQLDDIYPRDPKKLNSHTLIDFDDVIGEPPSLLSLDGVWEKSARSFTFSKDLCYLILTTLCGIPISVLCGLKFAWLSFGNIWCVTPCVKSCHLSLDSIRGIYSAFFRCVCDPFFESIGNMFGNIRVSKANL